MRHYTCAILIDHIYFLRRATQILNMDQARSKARCVIAWSALYMWSGHMMYVLEQYLLWCSLLTDKKPVDMKSATLFARRPVKDDITVRRQHSMERLCVCVRVCVRFCDRFSVWVFWSCCCFVCRKLYSHCSSLPSCINGDLVITEEGFRVPTPSPWDMVQPHLWGTSPPQVVLPVLAPE